MATTIATPNVEEQENKFRLSPPALSTHHLMRYAENTHDPIEQGQQQSVNNSANPDVLTVKTQAFHQEEPIFDKERSKVLLVEDNVDLAEIIIETLRLINIEIDHATHGTKAMEKFKELNPALVLLDLQLPDISGWRILDYINELQAGIPKDERTKIIVITSHDDPPNRLISKLQGVSFYLTKPITMNQLENVVNEALNTDE